ncbi:hypothetical protein HAHE_19590 [Haloferula helveola]|uniref:Uncharacterized protein n=1 Tax=Haloferula helveola TaxID=490095 RepID=A0ABM7RC86_9BACT|nr:hypothetical protein HAHE_19590 [Haloferula helveola]
MSIPLTPIVVAVVLCGCMSFTSCGTAEPRFTGPSALETGHWYRARTNPPTYYPKGLPREAPTGYRQGSWVYAGDSAGTRFFIPDRGSADLSSRELTSEALAAMAPEKKARLGEELDEEDTESAVESAIETASLLLLYSAGGLAGYP